MCAICAYTACAVSTAFPEPPHPSPLPEPDPMKPSPSSTAPNLPTVLPLQEIQSNHVNCSWGHDGSAHPSAVWEVDFTGLPQQLELDDR